MPIYDLIFLAAGDVSVTHDRLLPRHLDRPARNPQTTLGNVVASLAYVRPFMADAGKTRMPAQPSGAGTANESEQAETALG